MFDKIIKKLLKNMNLDSNRCLIEEILEADDKGLDYRSMLEAANKLHMCMSREPMPTERQDTGYWELCGFDSYQGEYIYSCSECGTRATGREEKCPTCGALMCGIVENC